MPSARRIQEFSPGHCLLTPRRLYCYIDKLCFFKYFKRFLGLSACSFFSSEEWASFFQTSKVMAHGAQVAQRPMEILDDVNQTKPI